MKGEEDYRDQKSNEMFSKLPQHQQQQQQHSLTSHFHLSSTATPTVDDSYTGIIRRPRGRPPGSKNKPKPPVFVTQNTEPYMSPYILEVPSGNDVVETINRFCRRKAIGVCVLSGSGSVLNVTLRQPSPSAPGSTITFHGKFDLLSVSATFLPPPPRTSLSPPVSKFFTVSLAGPQGQIIGGFVAGPLISAGTVYVIAASFNNPSYHRLPVEEEEKQAVGGGREGQSPGVSGGGEESGQMAGSGGESCGVSMYSCHMGGSDVIWAPAARAPPPY